MKPSKEPAAASKQTKNNSKQYTQCTHFKKGRCGRKAYCPFMHGETPGFNVNFFFSLFFCSNIVAGRLD
jgi:hypothetical protein